MIVIVSHNVFMLINSIFMVFFFHKKIVDFYVYYKNHNYWNLPADPIKQVVTKILLLLIKGCSTLLLMHASLDTV